MCGFLKNYDIVLCGFLIFFVRIFKKRGPFPNIRKTLKTKYFSVRILKKWWFVFVRIFNIFCADFLKMMTFFKHWENTNEKIFFCADFKKICFLCGFLIFFVLIFKKWGPFSNIGKTLKKKYFSVRILKKWWFVFVRIFNIFLCGFLKNYDFFCADF